MTKRKPLSTVVAEGLAERIRSGAIAPGAQLPTEVELCQEFDVSRTVVREAVARLRSDGMIVPQQGRGMFVSERSPPRTFLIPDDALATLPETIALLELRLSVETEAAGLCAERRSEEEAVSIRTLMEQTDERDDDPDEIQIHYDYDFHLAIAKATRNDFMHAFLSYLGPMIVPRFELGRIVAADLKHAYYARIHAEHLAIVDAIVRKDDSAARFAMRRHLLDSLERVRSLAAASGIDPTDAGHKHAVQSLFAELLRPRSAQ